MQYANGSVATLLRRHPWSAEVLEWHGVDVHEVDHTLSVGALCWLKRIDPQRLARDLCSARPDDDPLHPLYEDLEPGPATWGEETGPWWSDGLDDPVEQRWSA